MNDSDKELFICRIKGLMDDDALIKETKQTKILLNKHVKNENWQRVMELAEELSIFQEECVLRFGSSSI